jgi:hypothetical protein
VLAAAAGRTALVWPLIGPDFSPRPMFIHPIGVVWWSGRTTSQEIAMLNTQGRTKLLGAAVTSFSLTFVVVSLAILFDLLPSQTLVGVGNLDTGVVLQMTTLAALTLALGIEVYRTARAGRLPRALPARPAPLSGWRPPPRAY